MNEELGMMIEAHNDLVEDYISKKTELHNYFMEVEYSLGKVERAIEASRPEQDIVRRYVAFIQYDNQIMIIDKDIPATPKEMIKYYEEVNEGREYIIRFKSSIEFKEYMETLDYYEVKKLNTLL